MSYRWLIAPSVGRIADAPPWLLALIEPPVMERTAAAPTPIRGSSYAHAAVVGECQAVETAPEGIRNHTLNRAAFSLGQLVAAALLDEGEVVARLMASALASGLPRPEASRTIKSGIEGGKAKPRDMGRVA